MMHFLINTDKGRCKKIEIFSVEEESEANTAFLQRELELRHIDPTVPGPRCNLFSADSLETAIKAWRSKFL